MPALRVDLPFGTAELTAIFIGEAVGATERVVHERAGVTNKPLSLNLTNCLLQGITIKLNKERSALTNTHISIYIYIYIYIYII